MSTGIIIITVIVAIACVVAAGVMLAAGARALRTTRRNELGLASNNAREQANRTFGTTAVGLVIIFLTLLGMLLVMKLADGMVADPTEETPTSEAVDAH